MMKFRTTFNISSPDRLISYRDKILLTGSCFAENMGGSLSRYKFNIDINPNGILYNPVSIANTIIDYVEERKINERELFYHQDIWHHPDFHGRFSQPDKAGALQQMNLSLKHAAEYLKETDWLIITFGSSYIYQYKNNGKVAANCHQLPDAEFYKKMLSSSEIIAALDNMIHRLFAVNNKVKIIFTISPVRYIKDGLINNNLSKANLLQSVHHLVNKFDRLYYFPAYELVIDDLRDYRFFKEDLVHPNEMAINYVWEKFTESLLDKEAKIILPQISSIIKARQHKPLKPGSESFARFCSQQYEQLLMLKEKYPFLMLEEEMDYFERLR